MSLATKTLYSTKTEYLCDKHAKQIDTLANCMGWKISKAPPPKGSKCAKCIEETADAT